MNLTQDGSLKSFLPTPHQPTIEKSSCGLCRRYWPVLCQRAYQASIQDIPNLRQLGSAHHSKPYILSWIRLRPQDEQHTDEEKRH